MHAPQISVIIPCYCDAATLPGAVQSVLDQDIADFEILIVDDGSLDTSATVARRLAIDDARIRVIVQPHAGLAAARNLGIGKAQGRIIAFLDAADHWAPDHLRRHLNHLMANQRCGVSFARVRFFDPATARPGRSSAFVRSLSLARALGENPVCTPSNIVARRSVFFEAGSFDPSAGGGGCQEWIARVLATTAWQVTGLPQILVHHRLAEPHLAADLERSREGWLSLLLQVRGYAPCTVARAEAEAAALFYRFLACRALGKGQGRYSLAAMLRAVRASPHALLVNQPHRTAITLAGALAALRTGHPGRSLPTS